ncbi:MAG: M48 family metalloprotease, partial [Cyanobacteria bacterium J06639_1]
MTLKPSTMSATPSSARAPHKPQRWRRALATSVAIAGIVVGGMAPAAEAVDLGSLIFQGLRVIQLSNISDSQDVELGKQIHGQIIEGEGVTLSQDRQLNRYITQIGQQLVSHSSRSKLPFQFFVVEDDTLNAFATTGGFVYINTGTIEA